MLPCLEEKCLIKGVCFDCCDPYIVIVRKVLNNDDLITMKGKKIH